MRLKQIMHGHWGTGKLSIIISSGTKLFQQSVGDWTEQWMEFTKTQENKESTGIEDVEARTDIPPQFLCSSDGDARKRSIDKCVT